MSRLGRHEEALVAFDRVLSEFPENVDALTNRGVVLGAMGLYHDALDSFNRAIEIKPDFIDALRNRGIAYVKLARYDDALASYDQVLAISPADIVAMINRGTTLDKLRRYGEALATYERLLVVDPGHFDALNNRGVALGATGRHQEALSSYDRALAVKPDFAEALSNRGNALVKLGKFDDALASFDRALEIRPDYVDAMINRADVLIKLMRHGDALPVYDRILEIDRNNVQTLSYKSILLAKLKRYQEALDCADEAQRIQPDSAKANAYEGLIRLRMGDFEAGLKKYEWRWLDKDWETPRREMPQPLWIGRGSLEGKSILLHAEQGLGDAIQFVRYAPLVASKGASVLLEVPGAIAGLMTGLAGVSRVLVQGEPLPRTDFHCPLVSLPLALGTRLETIPAPIPYLSVEPAAAAEWRAKLAPGGEKLVGICWRGNPAYQSDHERSIRFAEFVSLLTVKGIRFVSLQKELTDEERRLAGSLPMVHPGADFKGTAEMIAALDMVISVDTVWAHWAGAIGKALCVLLPYAPHWVWHLERDDSPWYPTARLFRQSKIGNWSDVILGVKDRLTLTTNA